MSEQIREQLSALMDGELAADQARFLLRRIEGDAELARCWSRYQLAGAVLRRESIYAGPSENLPRAVMLQVAPKSGVAARTAMRALRWAGGGAIAAAVAVVALMATRPQEMTRPAVTTTVAAQPGPTIAPAPALAPIDLRAPISVPLPMARTDYAQPASYDTLLPLPSYAPSNDTALQRYEPYLMRPPLGLQQRATSAPTQAMPQDQ